MAKFEVRRFVRRLIMLGVLVSGLVVQTTSYNPQTASAKCNSGDSSSSAALPCCSACDVENPPLICRRGCSPSCKTK
jgi:hypothetical protein